MLCQEMVLVLRITKHTRIHSGKKMQFLKAVAHGKD